MARLILLKNPLALHQREEAELAPGRSVLDWLLENHPPPNGCGGIFRWTINGDEQKDEDGKPDLDKLDYVPAADDVVMIAAGPGWAAIAVAVISSIIVAGLSFAIQLLFFNKSTPRTPEFLQDDAQPNPAYTMRAQGNVARLGEPVPVIYGSVLVTPDHAMQPHAWFVNDEQWLDQLFVISQGEVDIHEVLLGDTPADLITGDALSYAIRPASVHGQAPGSFLGWHGDFYENVITCPEVQGIDLLNTGDTAGFFRLSKTGQTGRYVMVDIEWPAGNFFQASFGGNISPSHCTFQVNIQECDAAGNLVGPITTIEEDIFEQVRNPIRKTYTYDMASSKNWAVRVERLTPETSEHTNRMVWSGLKMRADLVAPVYGEVTLLAVRTRATVGLGSGEQLIRVRCTRKLPPLGSGALAATTNPADAFADMYCNQVYGARRPVAELDTAKLGTLRSLWAPYQFSAVYVARTIVWEALNHAVQGMAAQPLPVGAQLSVAQEGKKAARSMLFTEQNIARDSFSLHYEFDRPGASDGIEVEYREPANFAPAFVRVPAGADDPERIILFGCVSPTHAGEYGQLLWNKRLAQRQTIEFETELEGLIPYVGERVAVSHSLPWWGMSGFVANVTTDGLTVMLDRALPWAEVAGPHYMMFRREDSGASALVAVTEGEGPQFAILAADPWAGGGGWVVGQKQEGTHFAFGSAELVVRDFILGDVKPKGGVKVSLGGAIYNPAIYDGTLSFLAGAVP